MGNTPVYFDPSELQPPGAPPHLQGGAMLLDPDELQEPSKGVQQAPPLTLPSDATISAQPQTQPESWTQRQVESTAGVLPVASWTQRILRAVTAGAPEGSEVARYGERQGLIARGADTENMRLIAPEELMTEEEQKAHPFVRGALQSLGGMTSPENVAIAAMTGGLGQVAGSNVALSRMISAYFTYQMTRGGLAEWQAFADAVNKRDWDTAWSTLGQFTTTAAFATLSAKHALSGEAPPPTGIPITDESLKAQRDLEFRNVTRKIDIMQRTIAEVQKAHPRTPSTDEIADLRARIASEAAKRAEEEESLVKEQGFRDLGERREMEAPPALVEGKPAEAAVPILEGSPLTAEQRFAQAEEDAWKLVHEGRAEEAMRLLSLYDEFLREQPEAREERYRAQTEGEQKRLADESAKEEERLSAERGFRDLGRKVSEPPAAAPETPATPATPPPLATPTEIQPPPPAPAPKAKPEPAREAPEVANFAPAGTQGALASAPATWGGRGEVVTPENTRVAFQYAVVPASAVKTSFDANFKVNPDYPGELQPRDRLRAASQDQFLSLTSQGDSQLDFLRMSESANAGDGAPVVGVDLNTETRNMGTTALKTLYERNSPVADQYRDALIQNASKFGLDQGQVSQIDNPVLVRVRRTPMSMDQRADFAREANVPTTARMGATEVAKLDSQKLDQSVLGLLRPTDDGSINNVANADFVRAFMDSVASPTERGAYMRPDGSLSIEGINRIRNALFARAYPGADAVLEQMAESQDSNIRNVQNAMHGAAPRFAQMQDMIDRGILYDFGITGDIGDAAKKLSELRRLGKSVEDYLGQTSLGFGDIPDAARELLRAIHEKGRSVRGLTQILSDYAEAAMSRGRTDQTNMFGAGPVVSKEDLLRTVTHNNSLLDFGDEPPAPMPEPGPPPKVEAAMPPPPGAATAGFPPAKEVVVSPESIDRIKQIYGRNPKDAARALKNARASIPHIEDAYEDIRERGIDAVLERADATDMELAAENFGSTSDYPPEIEATLRANADAVVQRALTDYQQQIIELRATESALGGKAAPIEVPPPREQPAAKTPEQTVETLHQDNDIIRKRLQEARGTAEERAALRQRMDENNQMITEMEQRQGALAPEGQPQAFKASKKGGLALVGVTEDGREQIFREFGKEFLKKNRDNIVATYSREDNPYLLVDDKGNMVAESRLWQLRHADLSSAEKLQSLSDGDVRSSLDDVRSRLQRVTAGSRNFDDLTRAVSNLEDEIARRKAQEPTKPEFGSTNTIVTKDRGEELKRKLIDKMGGGTLYSGFDPEILSDLAEYGVYLVEGGVREIAAWTAAMAKTFGEAVRPYLDEVWKKVAPTARQLAENKKQIVDDVTKDAIDKNMGLFKAKTVRLYRAEAAPGTGKGVPDWVRETAQREGVSDAFGRWFTADPSIAQEYAERMVGPGARIVSVDVPENVAEQFRVSNLPEGSAARRFSADQENEFFVSRDVANEAKEVPNARSASGAVGTEPNAPVEGEGRANTPPPLGAGAAPEVRERAAPREPGDGTGVKPSRSPASLNLDAPSSVRGTWRVAPEDWRSELRASNLPESAPGPSVTLSPAVDRSLIYRPQKPIVEMAVSELEHGSGAFVIASSTGTGKNYMGAAIVKEFLDRNPGRQFVVALTKNNEISRTWKDVFANYGVEAMEMPTNITAPPEPGLYLSTYATLRNRPGMERFPWNLAVYDESSEMRNWQVSSQGAMGRALGQSAERNLYLSATPFSSAVELGYLEPLGLWRDQGFQKWARQFGVYEDKKTGLLGGGNAPLKLSQLREQLIQRGQYVNLDTDLSGHRFSVGIVPLADGQWEDLRNVDNAFRIAEDHFRRRNQASMIMASRAARVNYMKAYLERTRLPQAVELMKKLDAAGFKVAVFSETRAERNDIYDFLKPLDEALGGRLSQMLPGLPGVYDALHAEFGDQVANLSGSGNKSQEIKDFNDNVVKHIYATYQKGGMGVSLHDTVGTAPRAAIYLGPPWSGMLLQQGLGRIWRFGTNSDAYSIILGSDSAAEFNTITQRVLSRLESMHALVSGVDKENATIKSMRSIEDAADYALGNEDENAPDELATRANAAGIANYKDIPVPNAADYMNKGLQVERRDIPAPPGTYGAATLYSGFDPIAAARAARDLAQNIARLGTKIKAAFNRGEGMEQPPDPMDPDQRAVDMTVGTPSARRLAQETFEGEDPELKSTFTEAAQASAEDWANGSAGNPTAAVVGAWRKPIDMLRDAKNTSGDALGAVNDFIVSNGRMLIDRRGGDVGHEIAYQMIPDYHVRMGNVAGPWELRAMDLKEKYELSAQDWTNLHYAVEGLERPANDRVAAAVPEIRQLNAERAAALRQAGVMTQIFDRTTGRTRYSLIGDDPNYMQRFYDPSSFKPGSTQRENIIQRIMQRDGISRVAAENQLQQMRRNVPLSGTVERPREYDIPGYRTDFNAYLEGIEETAEAIARTEVFGQNREKLDAMISLIPEENNRKVVSDTMDQLLKHRPWEQGPKAILTGASNWSIFTKMTTSAIPAMSHLIKPAMYANLSSFGRALIDTIVHYPAAQREAIDVGALDRRTRLNMYREMGIPQEGVGTKWLRWTGFMPLDSFGRALAVSTAETYLERYALPRLIDNPGDQFVRRILQDKFQVPEELVDKAITDRAWGRDAMARAGKAYSDLTMYTYDPTELPGIFRVQAESEAGQTLAALARTSLMLKSYIWKNTYLFKDALISEARKGNFRPWLPFLLTAPLVGTAIQALTSVARNDKKKMAELFDQDWTAAKLLKQAAAGAAFTAAATSLSSVVGAIDSGRSFLDWAAGPVLSDAARTIDTAVKSVHDLINFDPSKHREGAGEIFMHKWQSYLRSTFVPLHPLIPPADTTAPKQAAGGFPGGGMTPPPSHSHPRKSAVTPGGFPH